jgi:hypothetical protein
MTDTYHYGIPTTWIWSFHILMGLLFIYLGYLIIEEKKVNKWLAITIIVLGVLAALYHAHLWYANK